MEKTVPNYGEAVQGLVREELLRNLVRRQYHESPQFTAFQGISHTRQVDASINLGTSFLRPKGWNAADANVVAGFTDYPTFSISPQQGPDFARQLHESLPLEVLPQMIAAGYSTELTFCLLVQEIAGIRGVIPEGTQSFKPASSRYLAMLNFVKALEDRNQLTIRNILWEEPDFEHPFAPEVFSPEQIIKGEGNSKRYTSTDGGKSFLVTSERERPALLIERSALATEPGRNLCDLLHLFPAGGKKAWVLEEPRFVQGHEPDNKQDSVTVTTRSFYGLLNLLALGIQLQWEENAISSPKQGSGRTGAESITSRFRVYFAPRRPASSFLAVKNGGLWFFIDQTDSSSQHIFNALCDLYQLQVAAKSSGSGSGPVTPSLSIRSR